MLQTRHKTVSSEAVNIIRMFTKSDSVRCGLSVQPEPDPGENHNESTGEVDLSVIMMSIDIYSRDGPVAQPG